MNKEYVFKAGILGAIVGLIVAMGYWLDASISMHCILAPAQTVSIGASCANDEFVSIYSVMYFGIPAIITGLIGMVLGMVLGWVYRKAKKNSSVVR